MPSCGKFRTLVCLATTAPGSVHARASGIVVLAAAGFLHVLEVYRRPGDMWHFACDSAVDVGATQLWQRIPISITMAVTCLPMDNMLEHAVGSIPIGGTTGVPPGPLRASTAKLAELSQPAMVFSPDTNFQVTPAIAALMMDERIASFQRRT